MSVLRLTQEEYEAKQKRSGRKLVEQSIRTHKRNAKTLIKTIDDAFVPKKKRAKKCTDYNSMLAQQMVVGLEAPLLTGLWPEYQFDPNRKWRIDFAWLNRMLAVEIDGAVHRIKGRWEKSFEREQALFFAGWRLLKVSTKQVRSGKAVKLIERALAQQN